MTSGDAGRGGAHRGGARGGARGGSSNRGRGMVASGQFTVGDIKKMDDDFDFAATTASFDKLAVKEEAKQAVPDINLGYDKKSSFFDNISCESSAGADRGGGYNRADEKKRDMETFGTTSAGIRRWG